MNRKVTMPCKSSTYLGIHKVKNYWPAGLMSFQKTYEQWPFVYWDPFDKILGLTFCCNIRNSIRLCIHKFPAIMNLTFLG